MLQSDSLDNILSDLDTFIKNEGESTGSIQQLMSKLQQADQVLDVLSDRTDNLLLKLDQLLANVQVE